MAPSLLSCPGAGCNPYTSLAWFEPEVASEFELSRYLAVCALAVMFCDWLTSLYDEVKMMRGKPLTILISAYVLSRLSSLVYLFGTVLFRAAPTGLCSSFGAGLASCYVVALPSTMILFCSRFDSSPLLRGVFSVLWVVVLASAFITPFATRGVSIGTTAYCIDAQTPPGAGLYAGTIVGTVYTLSLYGGRAWMRRELGRRHMLLKDCQNYYLTTVTFGIVSSAALLAPIAGASLPLRTILPAINLALANAMATRAFRRRLAEDGAHRHMPTLVFLPRPETETLPGATTQYQLDTVVDFPRPVSSVL